MEKNPKLVTCTMCQGDGTVNENKIKEMEQAAEDSFEESKRLLEELGANNKPPKGIMWKFPLYGYVAGLLSIPILLLKAWLVYHVWGLHLDQVTGFTPTYYTMLWATLIVHIAACTSQWNKRTEEGHKRGHFKQLLLNYLFWGIATPMILTTAYLIHWFS